jgi:FMN phosphatase YigB (HAD superfamily)
VFVDDLLDNVRGAREFGWRAVQYTRFDDLVTELRALGMNVD